jgi:NAD(P)-dependent dehydrogenase (short-subunit alcohol dehydrogenase family)
MAMPPEIREMVIVTGATAGLGAAIARDLAGHGFHVLAGVRRERDADAIQAPGIEPLVLDITDPAHIHGLVARINGDPESRGVRALVNNAALGLNAPVEAFPLPEWRRLFEVNLFGHVAMTQAVLPALIRSTGRVVNISSVGGKLATATHGPYAATKFALEAVSDALRREMAPLGVSVVVIEPGAIKTQGADRAIAASRELAAAMAPEQLERYGPLLHAAIATQIAANTERGLSADAVAKVVVKAITARAPRTRYTVGRDAAVLAGLVRVLPDRALDRILAGLLRAHKPETVPRN